MTLQLMLVSSLRPLRMHDDASMYCCSSSIATSLQAAALMLASLALP